MPATANNGRLARLRGSGLPLPQAFGVVVHELLDHGARTTDDFIRPLEREITKSERIHAADLYPETGYRGFAEDLITQLKSVSLVRELADGHWATTDKLDRMLGKSVTVMNSPDSMRVIFNRKEDRERLNSDATAMREIRAAQTSLPDSRSLHDAFYFLTDQHDRGAFKSAFQSRTFSVDVINESGRRQKRNLKLHPLSLAMPQRSEPEFYRLVDSIKELGVLDPIHVWQGQVIDGRHRLVIAHALNLPIPIREFQGETEMDAIKAISATNENFRVLTPAQKTLTVLKYYYPEAKRIARERQQQAGVEHGRGMDSLPEVSGKFKARKENTAPYIAARLSNHMVKGSAVEFMLKVLDAPETQERIWDNDPKVQSVAAARLAALAELGELEPEKPSLTTALGRSEGDLRKGLEALKEGRMGSIPNDELLRRANAIRELSTEMCEVLEGRVND